MVFRQSPLVRPPVPPIAYKQLSMITAPKSLRGASIGGALLMLIVLTSTQIIYLKIEEIVS